MGRLDFTHSKQNKGGNLELQIFLYFLNIYKLMNCVNPEVREIVLII